MDNDPALNAPFDAGWSIVGTLAEADGSHRHAMLQRLLTRGAAARDLADAMHALCMLHGRHPGVIDKAAERNSLLEAAPWFEAATEGFAAERALLARLASAVGPLPSTPGQAESEAAVVAQRHAIDMLAGSDRSGCALGAAIAVVIDWQSIRLVLDSAAHRLGVTVSRCALPSADDTGMIAAAAIGDRPATERAIAFGVQQVLAQHRGLWDLLETRMSARDAH